MSNLLKEAIADAKQVRKIALANAKIALEEAFQPQLQSMLSTRIQQEVEGDELEDEIPIEDEVPVDVPAPEMPVDVAPEVPVEIPVDDGLPVEEPVAAELPVEEPIVDEMPIDDELPVEEMEDPFAADPGYEDENEYEDVDLESIIQELERETENAEVMEEPEFDEFEENVEFDPITGEEPTTVTGLDTESKAVAVAKGAPAVAVGQGEPKINDTTDAITQGPNTDPTDLKKVQNSKTNTELFSENTDEEELDLEQIIKEIEDDEKDIEDSEEKEKNVELTEKVSKLAKSLTEHIDVIKFLKSKLNEVNLLNAKLLYTNKLFKSNNLNNDQKMKVIENFDRAATLKEVKLVYVTIAESFTNTKVAKKSVKKITEGLASRSTATKKAVVTEVKKPKSSIIDNGSAERLKKLAGIK